jgi:hypothetical protein
MSDTSTLRESDLDIVIEIDTCKESKMSDTSTLRESKINKCKLIFSKCNLFCSVEKISIFISLIINGLSVALLSDKNASKEVYSIGMILYLLSLLFLFSLFIKK